MLTKEKLIEKFGQNFYREKFEDLDEKQLTYKPYPGTWSAMEILEHVALVEKEVFRNAAQAHAETNDRARAAPEYMVGAMRDRSLKVKAPSAMAPKGGSKNLKIMLDAMDSARAELVEWLRKAEDQTITEVIGKHPMLGRMTREGWLLFAAEHSERHLAQLNELSARPDFPKGE